jgi:2-polyprenyl-3-methyl-5-hydroxy-6-metoxy-1,4-benzoquinol methylase
MNRWYFSKCPLCEGVYKTLYSLKHATIVKCLTPGCELIFTQEQPSDSQLQDFYNTHYYIASDNDTSRANKPNSDQFKFKQHLFEIDKRLHIKGKDVIDFGCGIGNFLEVARNFGVNSTMGVELNDRARELAIGRGFRVENDIDKFEYSSVDLIYMNDVIEHLRDPVATLTEIRRVLRPDGALFVVTMNVNGAKARLLGNKWELITDPTHFYFYQTKSLSRTLEQAGFTSIQEEKFAVKFSHHGFIRDKLQKTLVKLGLDTGLKMLAYRGEN